MRLTRKDLFIPKKPYITEKLDSGTLIKLLDSSFFVVDGIYQIKQGVKTLHKLYEEETISGMKLSAYVKVKYAYAGKARAQVKNVIPWKQLTRQRPSYELRINLYGEDQIAKFHFSQKYTNIDVLHDDIEMQTRILEEELFHLMKQK